LAWGCNHLLPNVRLPRISFLNEERKSVDRV